MVCSIIPDYLTKKTDPKQVIKAREIRAKRKAMVELRNELGVTHKEVRRLYDCDFNWWYPTDWVQEDIQTHSHDPSTDAILELANKTYDFFHDYAERESWDNENAIVKVYKNFGYKYNNAFWDGEGLTFGNGDGVYFNEFTILDVMGHEFAHAVTDTTSKLEYYGQPGALNEHFSDVAGICIKQYHNQIMEQPINWLIGEGIFTNAIQGKALRDMSNPGSAYNDPLIGKDPQPQHMDDYVETDDDEGGVHINSGIPNKAFYQFVTNTKLLSYEKPFMIWYQTLIQCDKDTDFNEFVSIMFNKVVKKAPIYKDDIPLQKELLKAWQSVGLAKNITIEEPEEPDKPEEPHKCKATKTLKKIKRILDSYRA